jgi:glutamate-1-semialdehyde 2,1-aminomutase
MAAGIATLRQLQDPDVYDAIDRSAQRLEEAARASIARHGPACHMTRLGSMFCVLCTAAPVTDLAAVRRCDTARFARLHGELVRRGVFFPPSQFETCFVSRAHTQRDIDATAEALDRALQHLAQ